MRKAVSSDGIAVELRIGGRLSSFNGRMASVLLTCCIEGKSEAMRSRRVRLLVVFLFGSLMATLLMKISVSFVALRCFVRFKGTWYSDGGCRWIFEGVVATDAVAKVNVGMV